MVKRLNSTFDKKTTCKYYDILNILDNIRRKSKKKLMNACKY